MQIFILFIIFINQLVAIGTCDLRPYCIDRSLYLTRNTGSAIHYVDITNFNHYNILKDEFTFEASFKLTYSGNLPEKLFIGGVWGPFEDKNDLWVVYINSQKELCFEVNSPTTDLKDVDNTIVKYPLADSLLNKWYKVACTFNGSSSSIKLYLNGQLKSTGNNNSYPANVLRKPASSNLNVQIGSTNAINNSGSNFLSFYGELDEIKIWNKELDQFEIECSNRLNFLGNEANLQVYYRCNNEPTEYELCDATGNDRVGLIRSNAKCDFPQNPRLIETYPFKFTNIPDFDTVRINNKNYILDTIKCDNSKIYNWSFIDTTENCGTEFYYYAVGWKWINNKWEGNRNLNGLDYTPKSNIQSALNSNVQVNASLTVNADFIGTGLYRFYIIKEHKEKTKIGNSIPNANRFNICGRNIVAMNEIYITRITDADYTADSLNFGVLLANCVDVKYRDLDFYFKNNTVNTGINKDIRINDIKLKSNQYQIIQPSIPSITSINDSNLVRVRFLNTNVPGIYKDTLFIYTDDRCEPFRKIPITGEIQEVIQIIDNNKIPIDTMNFGTRCTGDFQFAETYFWENLLKTNITVIDIKFPNQFSGLTANNFVLEPLKSYQQRYNIFNPKTPGLYFDSIIYVIEAEGCRIEKPVYVKAKGIFPKMQLSTIDTLDFGDVFIGQSSTNSFFVDNISNDDGSIRNYLFTGDRFSILSGAINSISANKNKKIDLEFRPLEPKVYYDVIRVEERTCGEAFTLVLKGRGVLDAFNYEPPDLRIDNVLSCDEEQVSLKVINKLSQKITLSKINLNDPSNKLSIVSPIINNKTLDIEANSFQEFIFSYNPNDPSGDRSDIAYLEYESLGQNWRLKLTATSVVPRLYMTNELPFGTIEVLDSLRDTVNVENITSVDIKIDGFILTQDNVFKIIDPPQPFDTILKPKETMKLIIEFKPDKSIGYYDTLKVLVSEPCEIPKQYAVQTKIFGFGKIVPLEISQIELSFGQISPCDCERKSLPLRNRSRANSIFIDSVWLDDINKSVQINSANTEYYNWSTINNNIFPIEIPKAKIDSLFINYCPRAPFLRDSLFHNAMIHVKASGPGWVTEDEVYLSGKQMLLFETNPTYREFPPTRVDTFSIQNFAYTKVPDISFNQNISSIVIDSIKFVPDENVFYTSNTMGLSYPISIDAYDSLWYVIDFKPRAAREYRAKMYVYMSDPCPLIDSTVEVYGTGFAPVFGLDFKFLKETNKLELDTFTIAKCDTLILPIFTNRDIPGKIVNISCKLHYDINKFQLEKVESNYLGKNCLGYKASLDYFIDSNNISNIKSKNLCDVTTNQAIFNTYFTTINNYNKGLTNFTVDSIIFDTDDVLLYEVIAEKDETIGLVKDVDFKILNEIDFMTVNILDCKIDSLYILNTGELPIFINEILEPNPYVKILNMIPDITQEIKIGDTVKVLFEYCPKQLENFDDFTYSSVLNHCKLNDSILIKGNSYAPPYDISTYTTQVENIIDTLGGKLNDTIRIPIYFEQDLFVNYKGIDNWIENFDFDVNIEYNPRALKYLNYYPNLNSTINQKLGRLTLNFDDIDSLKKSKIGEIEFKITLADSIYSDFNINLSNFDSEIMFYDLKPILKKTIINSTGSCNLSYLTFTDKLTLLEQNKPNPVETEAIIEFSTLEDAPLSFKIYNIEGNLVKSYFDENVIYKSDLYKINIFAKDFTPGFYYYVLDSGSFRLSKNMIIK